MDLVNQVYLLLPSFVWFYTALEMSRCLRWDACQAGLMWSQCADCRPTTSLRSSWTWWWILWYEAAVSPTTFRVLWKGAMEVSQECNAVNSLTEAYFVQVLYFCLITDYFDTVRLFSTLKRGLGQVFNAHNGEFLCHCLPCICLLPGFPRFLF